MLYYRITMTSFSLKQATPEHSSIILGFIKGIAEYEKLSHEVQITEELIFDGLFSTNANAKAIIAYENDTPIGFALYFFNYSTFVGKKGLYLEDLYVIPEKRGMGYGTKMFTYLANRAVTENCGRFEWSVLDWNTPAINFYKQMGAVAMNEWTVYRLQSDALVKVAQAYKEKDSVL